MKDRLIIRKLKRINKHTEQWFWEKLLNPRGMIEMYLTKWCFEWELCRRDGLSIYDVNDPNCPILNRQANDYDIIFSIVSV